MIVKTIRDVIGARKLYKVPPDATVAEAAALMASCKVGALAVVAGDDLRGILSERDIAWRLVGAGLDPVATRVDRIMTPDPVTVGIGDAISDALAQRLGDKFRHLPVMEGGVVVGILSYRDIPAEYLAMFERFREMSETRADAPY